jgi:hypothetical protein
MTAKAERRVPMWIVLAVILASDDLRFRVVEGAASSDDFSWVVIVGSRIGREDVEGSCSWVAIMKRWRLTLWLGDQEAQ